MQEIIIDDKRSSQPIGLRNQNGEILVYFFNETVSLGDKSFSMTKPNVVSLFINKSTQEFFSSKSIKNKIEKLHGGKADKKVTRLFNDYFECIMSSIINMYCAVETFANLCIPNDYIYRRKNSKRVIEEYNKELIERWCTLGEKLNQIIPLVYNIKSPNKMDFWNNFLLLEEFRNEIIHPKTYMPSIRMELEDSYTQVDNKFLNMLCKINIGEIIQSGVEVIKYVVKSTPANQDYPIFENSFPIKIKDVNEFGDELFMVGD